jgi:hypothetical protein
MRAWTRSWTRSRLPTPTAPSATGGSRFIHAYFPTPEVARRAAALGVAVDTQPAWYYKDVDALMPALGETRLRPFIGLAEWLRAGVKVVLNTDHMFGVDPDHSLNPYNPFLTLSVAVTRRTEGGQVVGPEQAISREDALRMMTSSAAWLSFEEGRKGSIEVGQARRSGRSFRRLPGLRAGAGSERSTRWRRFWGAWSCTRAVVIAFLTLTDENC